MHDPRRPIPICVIGNDVRRELFGTRSAIGQWLRVGDRRVRYYRHWPDDASLIAEWDGSQADADAWRRLSEMGYRHIPVVTDNVTRWLAVHVGTMIFVPLFDIIMGDIEDREVGSAAGMRWGTAHAGLFTPLNLKARLFARVPRVNLRERAYDIAIGSGTLAAIGTFAVSRTRATHAVVRSSAVGPSPPVLTTSSASCSACVNPSTLASGERRSCETE